MLGRKHHRLLLVLFICIISLLNYGCSSGGSGSGTDNPLETQDVSGIWNGYIVLEDNTSKLADGIVTEDDYPMFIGFDTLFIPPSGTDRFHVPENTATCTGDLNYSTWNTAGQAYQANAFKSGEVVSTVATKSSLGITLGFVGGGTYRVDGYNAKPFYFYYNNAYENPGDKDVPDTPSVNLLDGTWTFENTWKNGNTLTLIIANGAIVSGNDGLGNSFSGNFTLHPTTPQKHVYDVSLTLNPGAIQMTGLAAFANEYNNDDERTYKDTIFIIGAVDTSQNYFLVGHSIGHDMH